MEKIAVDLHIHSCLSPCGDEEMTPNNIVNMAIIKELDYIAVTDHNSAKNLPAVFEVVESLDEGICFLPGIEVTTKEEAHVLAYFKTVEQALELDAILYKRLPNILNKPELFGPQLILNSEDQVVGQVDKLLISATDIGISELCGLVNEIGGIIVPAHIDRKSYSIIASLGFVPPDLAIKTLEVSRQSDIETVKKSYRFFKDYQFIHASDAHQLEDIAEREYFLELADLQRETLLSWLGKE
ncbi:MAG: 3,5-nucleoside bisphosphate phosphatase [Eubacteriaceae bacterium]|nr:3,5-nucleoside bisphosphate phosphatase [Eubacteriaceae bacterium]